MSTTEISEEVPTAVALIDSDGVVVRATALFGDRCGADGEALSDHRREIEQVLAGERDHVSFPLPAGEVDISVVVGSDGHRHALVAIAPPARAVPDDDAPPLLDEPLDASPAMIWLKDLSGRYIDVNCRYLEALHTEAEQVCGKTDDELAPGESIEGLRRLEGDERPREPLEFEYTIAAAEGHPAFAVLRFALRDANGEPTAVCGVAAPLARAEVARSECARLMRLDRWIHVDESATRASLLDEWGVVPAGAAADQPPPASGHDTPRRAPSGNEPTHSDVDGDQFAAIAAELDAALATSARLERDLLEERRQATALREASLLSARRAHELLRTLSTEQAGTAELEDALSRAEASVAELESERDGERARAETVEAEAAAAVAKERASAEALRAELADAREECEQLRAELRAAPTPAQLESERASAHKVKLAGERVKAELATTAAALASEQRAAQSLRAELRAAEEETVRVRSEARVRAEQSEAEKRSGLSQAHAELRRTRAENAEANAALQSERQTVASLRDELAAIGEELEHIQSAAADRPTPEEFTRQRSEADRALTDARSELRRAREELAGRQAEAVALSSALAAERETVAALRSELSRAGDDKARTDADAVTQAGREASEAAAVANGLRVEIDRLTGEVADRDRALEQLRARDRAGTPAAVDPTTANVSAEDPGAPVLAWKAASQRALSAGLVGVSEWSGALEHAVNTLGANGPWDAVVGWSPDERRRSMRCTATWVGRVGEMAEFDTRAWQHRRQAPSAVAAAGHRAVSCTVDLEHSEDSLLREAAQLGMGSAALITITADEEVVGMLDLLSTSVSPPDPELTQSLEGIALQLAAIAQQVGSARSPHWHFGRL